MSKPDVVLSIDDNESNQDLLKLSLNSFDVQIAMNGEQGLTLAKRCNPDLILLDVAMPGLNGFEVCQALKQDPTTENIPVIFLSAMNSLEDRIKSYKVGGEDYISKPFNIVELQHKIQVLLAYQKHLNELNTQVESASSAAMTALTNSSEMGVVIQFVDKSVKCHSIEALAEAMLSAITHYSLHGSMVVRVTESDLRYYSNTIVSPLETQLLEHSKDGSRIVSFGKRAIFNSRLATILIKDMPESDDDRAGRLKDHIAIILSCAEARINAILNEELARKYRASTAQSAIREAAKTVDRVTQQTKEYQNTTHQTLKDFTVQLEAELLALLLPEDAERRLLDLTESAQDRFDDALDIGKTLESMLDTLSHTLKKMT